MDRGRLSPSSPIAPAPPGLKSNFIDPPSRKSEVIGVISTFTALGLISVVLRMHTRVFISRAVGWDDYASMLAAAVSIAFAGIHLNMIRYGLGYHMWDVPLGKFSPNFLYYGSIGILLYPLLMLFAKTSILLFYYRLFKPNKLTGRIIYATIALVVVYNIAMGLAFTFLCIPRKENLDIFRGGSCSRVNRDSGSARHTSPALVGSAFNVLTDFIILALPMPSVYKLQLPMRQRIAVMAIFATGAFVCALSILRLQNIAHEYRKGDMTWNLTPNILWSHVEANIGILCGCMPCLKPFFRRYNPSFLSRLSATSRRSLRKTSRASSNRSKVPAAGQVAPGSLPSERHQRIHSPLTMHDPRFRNGSFLELGSEMAGDNRDSSSGAPSLGHDTHYGILKTVGIDITAEKG